ncbi:M20 aminoacylase family protein [Bartonella sp. LJL80]
MTKNSKAVADYIASYLPEMVALRHQIHTNPELGFEEKSTSNLVAGLLEKWGYQVSTGIAGTGVVATLRAGQGTKTLGLRADMDALPIMEQTGLAYSSRNSGKMHACGHDGHTTTLLTVARYLAETKDFSGTLHLIFQPAEEGLGGARKMVEEGLFDKFPCDAVFGYHNVPGVPAGKFCFIEGAATTASDRVRIVVKGKSGHGAQPQTAIDPIVVGSAIVSALQTVVSRNIDPLNSAVITVASFQAGDAYNIIPETAELKLTVRSYDDETRDLLEARINDIAKYQAEVFGAQCDVTYMRMNPACKNDRELTRFGRDVAEQTFGAGAVLDRVKPFTFSEDFAFMLQQRPGCYLFIGNGNTANLHNDHYNFNDDLLLTGATYWAELTKAFLV